MRILILTILALLGHQFEAAATDWTATSTTAIAITGDIAVHADRIVFANGTTLNLVPVESGGEGIYRVDPPTDPELNNGNRLCGRNPVRFIALGRSEQSGSLADSPRSLTGTTRPRQRQPWAWAGAGTLRGLQL